jgi:DNA-binding PadR family transcriptional regulator
MHIFHRLRERQRHGGHHEFSPRGHHGHGPFGFDWDGDHGGRKRRQRLFDGDELRLALLKLIADQPRHGYDLIRAIEELTGGNYIPSAGVVYPALSVLQDLGHIEGADAANARKVFTATPEGLAELAAQAQKVAELFARLAALATTREGFDAAPIRRAMENLRNVLRHRLSSGDADKNTLYEVAAILDEAVQRIERL